MLTSDLLSEEEEDGPPGSKRLFRRPEQEETYGRLDALAKELQEDGEAEDEEPEYLENFAESVRQELLLVGTMSLDAIQVR